MIYAIVERDFDGGYTPLVKIGYVSGVGDAALRMLRKRLCKLQSGNPRRLVAVGFTEGTRENEKALHYRFTDARIRRPNACEWLHVTDAVAAWMDSVRIEPVEVSPSMGRGSRGGTHVEPTRTNVCAKCGSAEHTHPRCPRLLAERTAPPLFKTHGRHARKRGEWTWRGTVRKH